MMIKEREPETMADAMAKSPEQETRTFIRHEIKKYQSVRTEIGIATYVHWDFSALIGIDNATITKGVIDTEKIKRGHLAIQIADDWIGDLMDAADPRFGKINTKHAMQPPEWLPWVIISILEGRA